MHLLTQSRSRHLSLLLLLVLAVAPACAYKARKPKPALTAQAYPCRETHATEHVTIAAEPGESKDTIPDTRLDYTSRGFISMRVIVTNDSDEPVDLSEARIHFVAADNTVIPAATDDDLERRMFDLKDATGTRLPLGIPIPITVGKKNIDKKILDDDDDFGFKTTTVAPHTTVAGYLFYDIHEVDKPVLQGAVLELRKVRFATSNKYLDSFEIPLQPNPKSTDKPTKPTSNP